VGRGPRAGVRVVEVEMKERRVVKVVVNNYPLPQFCNHLCMHFIISVLMKTMLPPPTFPILHSAVNVT
jgi:hypothetical protein